MLGGGGPNADTGGPAIPVGGAGGPAVRGGGGGPLAALGGGGGGGGAPTLATGAYVSAMVGMDGWRCCCG